MASALAICFRSTSDSSRRLADRFGGFVGCGTWGVGRIGVVLACVLVVSGCGGTGGRPPIADSVYVEVLMDLALVQGRAVVVGDVPDSVADSIFAAHDLTRAHYAAAAEYYAARPDSFRVRLEEALDRLAEEKRPGFRR